MRKIAILDRHTIKRWCSACDSLRLDGTSPEAFTAECLDLHLRRLAAGGGAWARPPIWGVVRNFG